jgi:DNA invertase Pin-like site-specific DNA recombinase
MITADTRSQGTRRQPPSRPTKVLSLPTSTKIREEHAAKLAIVYVRQSSPQQVVENQESRARQYALADFAKTLGWPAERVLVIDEDQGQSGTRADNRSGFQRVLTEVTMDHVGMVLSLEMSRLARSSKDWHHLLEVCGVFGSLLADQDGVYDPSDPNDRLLLGLKGTMSEVELHTMRNRLDRGRLNKAERGELFYGVPAGYVILPHGEVAFDPDEQARSVVQLLFEKFEEIGSLYGLMRYLVGNDIQLPIRVRRGPNQGKLEWHRASVSTLASALHNPIYAGAYAYGRRASDPKTKYAGAGKRSQKWQPMSEWKVLLRDRLPAYITWEQYLQNQLRLQQNRRGQESLGTPGQGVALLGGLVVCGNCGRRMAVSYRNQHAAFYGCVQHLLRGRERSCYGLRSNRVDDLLAQQVLKALTPAALELSMKALEDVEKERARLDKHWQQQLQRVRYEVDLAERRYQAVDPANRLVASSLEQRWEEGLKKERQLQEDYDRFLRESPPRLSAQERATIQALAQDIPALWHAPATTNADRKQIIRLLVERVVVHVRCDSEQGEATIHWKGGYQSQHAFTRPVATYSQLQDFERLLERVLQLRSNGRTAAQIAQTLNDEGFHPPKRRGPFTTAIVHRLLIRRGLIGNEKDHDQLLGTNEWWLTDLARELQMGSLKLRDWAVRGWLHSRRTPIQKYWILWADHDEVKRLKKLLAKSQRGINAYTSKLITPKSRPRPKKNR